jgi:peptidyl-prolyl cis-trans isomerase B (cyclophilin B)
MRPLAAALALVLAPCAVPAAEEEVAVVATPLGEIAWRFLPEAAPGHVAYVRSLIARGFYDGTLLHRVIPHFVIQGGDPNSRGPDRSTHGEGEADRRLRAEFSALHYRPGTVGMARDVDPDSGSCQFFVALEDLPRLDGRYTIFGEVVEGLEVARRIAEVPRDLADHPLPDLRITVRLVRRQVPAVVRSLGPGGDGELLTGPTKPLFLDPADARWTAPRHAGGAAAATRPGAPRLEVAIDEAGAVIDVRFPEVETPEADRLRALALGWRFTPARLDGKPVKARLEVAADGTSVGRSRGAPAP